MDTTRIKEWTDELLDTSMRNNLINFKDTKTSSVEIVLPDFDTLFDKMADSPDFEVYDPRTVDEKENDTNLFRLAMLNETSLPEEKSGEEEDSARKEYIAKFSSKVKKANQILLYNPKIDCSHVVDVLKNIDKKFRTCMEETGVNVAYIAFGFIHWKDANSVYRAPLLLHPVTFSNTSPLKPWVIRVTEDDFVVNPTFNVKLKMERGFELSDYQDEDHSDEDFSQYIGRVAEQVKPLGWTVSKECKIGIFSFLKINMYHDLQEHQEAILQHPNIRAICGEAPYISPVSIEDGEHHLKHPLTELHSVVDADSSQIEAIELAKAGVSFVLQGPPGTGKSQTITNIIAECLYDGKKVLFVSEKQAALNVVYNKLQQAGLDEFCLALHSYRANKKDVIAELCQTLQKSKVGVSDKATQIIESKSASEEELNAYHTELFAKREGINECLYDLYGKYSSCREAPDVRAEIKDIASKGETYLAQAVNLLEQYKGFIPSIGYQYKDNAWYGYINADASYQLQANIKHSMEELLPVFQGLHALQGVIAEKYGIHYASFEETNFWEEFFRLIARSDILTLACLNRTATSSLLGRLPQIQELSSAITQARERIDSLYDAEIYGLDGTACYRKLTRQFTGWFGRLINSEYKELRKSIRLTRKDGKNISYSEAVEVMEHLSVFQQKTAEFAGLEEPIKGMLDSGYNGVDSDWELIRQQVSQLAQLLAEKYDFGKLEKFSLEDYRDNKGEFAHIADKLRNISAKCRESVEFVRKSFDGSVFDICTSDFQNVVDKLVGCLGEYDKLNNWRNFYNLLCKLKDIGLLTYVDEAIAVNVEPEKIVTAYKRIFYREWIYHIQSMTPVLSNFNRVAHDITVQNFGEQDKKQFAVNRAMIRSELSAKRPSLEGNPAGSAASILLREGQKKRKQMSIRVLFGKIGELVQVIKPCLLMSPLSVSTYLTSEEMRFDVVIFDEASQVFPQDAIGAIYRGKQLIVVGDPKQLPPTDFFNASDGSDGTGDGNATVNIANFESILDICSTVFVNRRLLWHYRSRYEQLIAFSNVNFYDDSLITFPSSKVDRRWSGVDYYNPRGVYEKQRNIKEAEFVVDLIYENFAKYPNRSLGVVAFSTSQQDCIERILSERRRNDPSREDFFSRTAAEPFFVKNLETVQGDERDTIIFSIGYARDAKGMLRLNFGPLNRDGGERRLNVAVTRAKINVQVVSSIHGSDIDLKRAGSAGARLLREYLDYAENGEIALERNPNVPQQDHFDSEFEAEVCDFLRQKGLAVDTQVGCSKYRIDLAVKRPDSSDYVLAVECDGATYHSARNARDRDRLRQAVLEGMGWKFYRIWSTDWFRNGAVARDNLLEAVEEALSQAEDVIEDAPEEDAVDLVAEDVDEVSSMEEIIDEPADKKLVFPPYIQCDLHALYAEARDFQDFVKHVLRNEAPLAEEWFLQRIAWIFGSKSMRKAVREEEYNKLMADCENNGIVRKDGFLCLENQNNFVMRVPADGGEKRKIEYICSEEIAAGMLEVIKQNISMEKAGLYRLIRKELGFARSTDKISAKFDEALEVLSTLVDVSDDKIKLRRRDM